jgi:hypothetical protein
MSFLGEGTLRYLRLNRYDALRQNYKAALLPSVYDKTKIDLIAERSHQLFVVAVVLSILACQWALGCLQSTDNSRQIPAAVD